MLKARYGWGGLGSLKIMGVCGCERRDKGSVCEGVGVPVRKRADLCAGSVSVGMATDVNGRGTAGRGDGEAEHGCAWCKVKESTLTSRHTRFCVQVTQGEWVRVMQIFMNMLSLSFMPLSCHLWLVQRQPPVPVTPESPMEHVS